MGQNWKKTQCFLLMLYCLKCIALKNSAITCAVTNDSVIFTCKCIGGKDVDAVSWYSGSTDVPLTIVANSCRAVSLERSHFVRSSINNFTCGASSNIYTLNLKNRPPRYNVSCTCLDPDPQEPVAVLDTMCPEAVSTTTPTAVSTTTPTGNSGDVVGDGGGLSLIGIGLIIAVVISIGIGIGICWICKRNTGKYKITGPKEKTSSVFECSYRELNKTAGQDSSSQDGIRNYNDIRQAPRINI